MARGQVIFKFQKEQDIKNVNNSEYDDDFETTDGDGTGLNMMKSGSQKNINDPFNLMPKGSGKGPGGDMMQ